MCRHRLVWLYSIENTPNKSAKPHTKNTRPFPLSSLPLKRLPSVIQPVTVLPLSSACFMQVVAYCAESSSAKWILKKQTKKKILESWGGSSSECFLAPYMVISHFQTYRTSCIHPSVDHPSIFTTGNVIWSNLNKRRRKEDSVVKWQPRCDQTWFVFWFVDNTWYQIGEH